MKALNEAGRTVIAVVAIVVLAGAFWLVLLQPKRDKASELSKQRNAIAAEVASEQAQVSSGEAAKQEFPADYRQMVQLGKAVPSQAETSSLVVQLNGLSSDVQTNFKSIVLGAEAEGGETTMEGEVPTALAPLGASPGPAGLLAMPYSLEFEGGFFDLASFLRKLDSMVQTKGSEVSAKGRLVMVDGFSLTPLSTGEEASSGGTLAANLSVNTYVTPPGQGLTAGVTAAGPVEATTEPSSTETTPDEP
jgi:Tfp pilus assembly protein PilO